MKKPYIFFSAFIVLAIFISSCANRPVYDSRNFHEGTFRNQNTIEKREWYSFFAIMWRYMTEQSEQAIPKKPIPLSIISKDELQQDTDGEVHLYRLGHSSLLLKHNQQRWLIDPVFSDRASPVSWYGPKRFHPIPFDLNDLGAIDGILISHDHYDHLDKETIKQLSQQVRYFVVPLGVEQYLIDWGVNRNKIFVLDWWQVAALPTISITATPAQHFSGRSLGQRNTTLWASWIIRIGDKKLFYSGDSGYFDGFAEIGKRYGPFDLTLMENGAYSRKLWPEVHMFPEETVQAHLDLRGEKLMPIHNSTFPLAFHAWNDPMNQVKKFAEENDVKLITPKIGERVIIGKERAAAPWWLDN